MLSGKGFDPVVEDPPEGDVEFPSGLDHLNIDSNGANMLGVMYRPSGEGPHPTAVILHGFPGHERNLDLAHVLTRAGWNTVVFHYRGAWGSEGEFSFSNMLDDVHACLENLRSEEWEGVVDPKRITLIGHSMGGWAAFMAASEDPSILEVVSIAGFDLGGMKDFLLQDELIRRITAASFTELIRPLSGTDPEKLIGEIVDFGDAWVISDAVRRLRGTRILIIGASRDQVSIPELHHIPLSAALNEVADIDITIMEIPTDHNFTNRRTTLARTILHWLDV
ncbi:MAG: alpha/beta hydrolase family protein [Thermoplasmatota archaeon]